MLENVKVTIANRPRLGALAAWGIVLIALSGAAAADDTIIGSIGGRLVPLNSKHIRLVSEKVQVKLDSRGGSVWCQFVLKNEGPAARVKVGFPQKLGEAPLERFRCTVNGQPIEVHNELVKKKGKSLTHREHPYDGWHWWWMRFGRNETKTVVNRYQAKASASSSGNHWFSYVLKTGATWKGPIGRADMEIDVGAVQGSGIYKITPSGYRRQGHQILWTWQDFEPQEDIRVEWNPDPRLWIGVDGTSFSVTLPARQCLLQGRVYVPVRRLAKALEVKCDVEANAKTLIVHRGKADDPRRVIFSFGSREAQVRRIDGSEEVIPLPDPVFPLNGETMVPLRVLADALGWGLVFTAGARNFGNYGVRITHYER